MPVVQVQLLGQLSEEKKSKIAHEITETLKNVAGKPPEYTYVIFNEVDHANWAHKGKLFSEM